MNRYPSESVERFDQQFFETLTERCRIGARMRRCRGFSEGRDDDG